MAVKKIFPILTLTAALAACAGTPGTEPAQVAKAVQPAQAAPAAQIAQASAESISTPSSTTAQATMPATGPVTVPATAPAKIAVTDAPAKPNPTARRARARAQASQDDPTLPTVPLTRDVIVKFLAAEIASQRENWAAAYVNMFSLAQQTRDPRIARRAAELAVSARQVPEALAAVRLWRQLAPASDEASQFYLGLLMLSDDLTEAGPLLQQRLADARAPLLGSAILQVQRLTARARNKAAAMRLLEQVYAPYANMPETRIALAQQAAANGDAARAVDEARAALTLDPTSEAAILTLAQVVPEKDQAIRVVTDFLRANPASREVRLAYARMLVEQKQYEPAREQFRLLLKTKPDDLAVLYALGLLAAQNNDLTEAEKHLKAYLQILAASPDEERDSTQALMVLAQIAEQRNDIPGALKLLEQVNPTSQETYVSAQVRRAQLIAKSGNVASARNTLREARPENEEGRVTLLIAEAQILRTVDQTQEGMEVLAAGLKEYPENTDLLYDYALLAEKLGQMEEMETALRKVIRIAPSNQHAYNALGYSLAERNLRLEEAYTLIEKALSLAPEDPYIMDSMGWVQFRLGRLKQAEELLRKAYALRPDPEIAVHLGEVLWVIGQRDDAKKFWRDASSKDPKNDTLRSTLARLQVKL